MLLHSSNDAAYLTLIPSGNNPFMLYVAVYLKGTSILVPYSCLCVLCCLILCVLGGQKSVT